MPDEVSSGWLALSSRVRNRLAKLQHQALGTPIEDQVNLLAADTRQMCDHVERLHQEAHRLLSQYGSPASPEASTVSSDSDSGEMQRAAVNIQREEHEQSGSAMEVIKALFLWRDTPDERVREVDSAP